MSTEQIRINNCNNIERANISILSGGVSIKYGFNGTGKSTISAALKAKAENNPAALHDLQPFGSDKEPSVDNIPFQKVLVFNEAYVQKYLIKNNASFDDSYSVLIRSDETEALSEEINTLLSELHNLRTSEKSIAEIFQFLGQYLSTVSFSNDSISRRGGISEIIHGNGYGFEKYPELAGYSSFYSQKLSEVNAWAKWRTDGIGLLKSGEDTCPFCTGSMNRPLIDKQNMVIKKVFKNSALKTAQAILEFLQEGVRLGYINPTSKTPLENYLGDTSKSAEIVTELTRIGAETNYLATKIQKIIMFAPMNVTNAQLDHIDDTLREMIIETSSLSNYYATDAIRDLAETINQKINSLLLSTGKLRGLFKRHEDKNNKMIENREEDINDFLSLAGFPYKFFIQKQGEKKATTKLIPRNIAGVEMQANKHLSWGEKNAFALVLFMFEAYSENADLVILDDPISSFDINKKFAIMKRMFESGKPSFRGKTVLILTHDLEPVIDYVHANRFGEYGISARADYLLNNDGILEEQAIEKEDLKNVVSLSRENARNANLPLPVRIVNLRKFVELTNSDYQNTAIYHLLSSLIHGRECPAYPDETAMDTSAIAKASQELADNNLDGQYDQLRHELSTANLYRLAQSPETYVKIIASRFLFERINGLLGALKKAYPAAAKFMNETNHIENDYVFQLNPCKYFEIPKRYLDEITHFLDAHKTELLRV